MVIDFFYAKPREIQLFLIIKKKGEMRLIYEKIKSLCQDKKLSIAYVESKAGLSNGTIGKWSKSTNPSVLSLKAVADVLDVKIEDLLD